jgi:hypothetical protein
VPSSKYHREQAQVLAGLALSTHDSKEVERFTQAAMKHLERAQATEAAGEGSPHTPAPNTYEYADGA